MGTWDMPELRFDSAVCLGRPKVPHEVIRVRKRNTQHNTHTPCEMDGVDAEMRIAAALVSRLLGAAFAQGAGPAHMLGSYGI